MPSKSRKRRGKFKQPSGNKKSKRSSQNVILQQEIATPPEEIPTIIPEAHVLASSVKSQPKTKKHELFFELRRIGIFASLMLVVLIVLAIMLK